MRAPAPGTPVRERGCDDDRTMMNNDPVILISSTGEGLRLAVQGVEDDAVSVFVVAERPDGRRTQCVTPAMTRDEAESFGQWLAELGEGRAAVGDPDAERPQVTFGAPELGFTLAADDEHEATLLVYLSGAAGPAWVDEAERGTYLHHLPLNVRHEDLEVAALHWRRELDKAAARAADET